MNSFSIAGNNLKNNIRAYGLHLMAIIFSVAVYYDFISLKYNPEVLSSQSKLNYMSGAAYSTAVVLLVFLIFFIWYSNSFFLRHRKKEIGIYAFMGVNNSQIGYIFAIEGFFMGIIGVGTGLFIGVLTGKLFMMLLAKVAILDVKINFFISVKGLIETAITFLIIFALTSIKSYFDITRSKLIDLFNASRKQEGLHKVSYLKGIFSIMLIGAGYYTSRFAMGVNFIAVAFITILLVVWGTYWLFGSFLSAVTRYLLSRKRILYNGVNIVSISNIAFRIKKNYKALATIAILIATTVTAFGTVTSLRYYVNETYDIEMPYSFSYVSDDYGLKEKVKGIINKSNHNILLEEEVKFLYIDNQNSNLMSADKSFVIVRFSDFQRITRDLGTEDGEKIIEKVKPLKGEATFIEKPGVIMSLVDYESIDVGSESFRIKTEIKTPLFGNGMRKVCLVVHDEDYERLKKSFKQHQFNGIIVDNQNETLDLAKELYNIDSLKESLFAYVIKYKTKYEFIGVTYFLGCFLSLVFIIATGSIIYFKLLSEAFADKSKYEILSKIGMTRIEVSKAISKQVGISFILPLVIGSIHSCFAIAVLSKILNFNLIMPTIISIVVFAIVYGIFYVATTRKFIKIVC